MFGIIDKNKKFILLDDNRDTLRTTALMLAKEVEGVVIDYDEEGNPSVEHVEKHYEPMFTEDTVDEAIAEYTDEQIETAYNGEKYIKGYAPVIDNEYQSKMREQAYEAEVEGGEEDVVSTVLVDGENTVVITDDGVEVLTL